MRALVTIYDGKGCILGKDMIVLPKSERSYENNGLIISKYHFEFEFSTSTVKSESEGLKWNAESEAQDAQIVIELNDNEYAELNELKEDHPGVLSWSAKRILDGTPLSEGHGDLIDVNRKITVSTYDDQYEEWREETLTVLEALNKWSNEGVTVKDIVIPADKESEVGE